MAKVQISYENEAEKTKIIEILKKELTINNISKPYKSGKYSKVYIDVK